MIKLLHLADLHIGVENYGRVDPVTGLHTRLLDYLARLDEAIDVGLAEGVDAVIIAGDVYKSRTPNPTHQREFARRIHRLRAAELPVLILTGNHDVSPAAGRAHAVEIFDTLALDGVVIADRPRTHVLETRAGPLQVIALPWVTRHNLLTREELRLASILEVETMLVDRIDRFLSQAAEDLDPDVPAVLTVHGTIAGATLGSEQSIMLGRDMVLPKSVVSLPGVDYVALGHIHKHQTLGEHPPVVYPGSIERIDFGEEREDKGCVLVELAKGAARWRFHKLAARPFVTVAVDVRDVPDPQARVEAALAKRSLRDAVVRVRIEARPEQAGLVRTEELRRQIEEAGAFSVAAVALEVERTVRSRLSQGGGDILEGLTPRRALELYLRAKTPPLPEERIAALLGAADELFAEGGGT
jgi:DNA repair protein SbcD/Mre11